MDMQRFQDNAKPSEIQAAQLQQAFKKQCKQAATSLFEADVFVVITGAGFSADSGLAVYADVARVPAYLKLGVTYEDLCQPHWLSTAPGLFYGFWGQCYNDYRDTPPHAGYRTVARWRDDKNKTHTTTTSVAAQIRTQIAQIRPVPAQEDSILLPPFMKDPAYPVQGDPAGAFFCYTSNVDAHWFDVCEAQEIHECHGNVELWQCRHPYQCRSGIWRAPLEHRFRIDQDCMEAPPSTKPSLTSTSSEDEDEDENASDSDDSIDRIFQKLEKKEHPNASATRRRKRKKKRKKKRAKKRHKRDQAASVPVIGHVLGKGDRTELLLHMPASTNPYQWRTDDNWPKCGKCQDLARPAILMFGDKEWLPDHAQKERWEVWQHALFLVCQQRQQQKQPIKVCILEIGCGMNVPTCRVESEQLVGALLEIDGDVDLIRVNPDYPLASFPSVGEHTIPIMSRGLQAIEKIDHYYAKLQRKEKRRKKGRE